MRFLISIRYYDSLIQTLPELSLHSQKFHFWVRWTTTSVKWTPQCSWGDLKDKFSYQLYFTQFLHAEDLVYCTLLRGNSLLFPEVIINTAAPRKFRQLLGKWASLGIEWKWWKLFLQCFPNIVRMILSLFHIKY